MSPILAPESNAERRVVPPLQSGDRLTRDEFERRYAAMPDLKKAELIDGVVYVASPVSCEDHAEPQADFMFWLGLYRAYTSGVRGGDNGTIHLDLDTPQPDAYLRILSECGGQAALRDGYVVKAPELVAEVAASSASYDLHDKQESYRDNGVREYIVWRVLERGVDWFVLHGDRYDPLPPDSDGVHRSRVFPGLWLDAAALIRGDLLRVATVAQEGLQSAGHAEFVAQLEMRRRAGGG